MLSDIKSRTTRSRIKVVDDDVDDEPSIVGGREMAFHRADAASRLHRNRTVSDLNVRLSNGISLGVAWVVEGWDSIPASQSKHPDNHKACKWSFGQTTAADVVDTFVVVVGGTFGGGRQAHSNRRVRIDSKSELPPSNRRATNFPSQAVAMFPKASNDGSMMG